MIAWDVNDECVSHIAYRLSDKQGQTGGVVCSVGAVFVNMGMIGELCGGQSHVAS